MSHTKSSNTDTRKDKYYMDIKKLTLMLAVDEYGSFTRAGEELG